MTSERRICPMAAKRMLERLAGISVSKATFYRWLNSGFIPSLRIGHRYYIKPSDIEKLSMDGDLSTPAPD